MRRFRDHHIPFIIMAVGLLGGGAHAAATAQDSATGCAKVWAATGPSGEADWYCGDLTGVPASREVDAVELRPCATHALPCRGDDYTVLPQDDVRADGTQRVLIAYDSGRTVHATVRRR